MTLDDQLPVFDDGKAPDALRTIGEVAKALAIRQHVLRYWEEQFPMLSPIKRSGGRRYYRPEDIRLLQTIDRLVHREGYTLRGARLAIEDRAGENRAGENRAGEDRSGAAPPAQQAEPPRDSTGDLLPELRRIRNALAQALAEA